MINRTQLSEFLSFHCTTFVQLVHKVKIAFVHYQCDYYNEQLHKTNNVAIRYKIVIIWDRSKKCIGMRAQRS